MGIFIELSKVSINGNRFNFSKVVLFLVLILLVSIILSGAVSADQRTSQNRMVPSNLTLSHECMVDLHTTLQSSSHRKKTKTNSINSKRNQTLPDPQIYKNGVPVARGIYTTPGHVYPTIAAAIKDALNGDTIMLEKGKIFYEHSLVVNKNLDFKVFNNGYATINGKNVDTIFYIGSGKKVTFQNLIITGGLSIWGGAIQNRGNLNVKDCTFTRNSATDATGSHGGGAIYNTGILNVIDCKFVNNNATNGSNIYYGLGGGGGAIFNNGTLNVKYSTFTSNSATNTNRPYGGGGGGAIFNFYGNSNIKYSTFTSNHATDTTMFDSCGGGAIFNIYGNLNVKDCTFTRNSATNNDGVAIFGGAIFNSGDSFNIKVGKLYVTSSSFNGNTAYYGGAIAGDSKVTDSNFKGNTAVYGGAVCAIYGDSTVNDSNFNSNTADQGGAIYGDSTVTDSNFNSNTADQGGAIKGDSTVTDSNFKGNRADQGGAIFGGVFNINDCIFLDNRATNMGGAIYSSAGLTLNDSIFNNNSVIGGGGAIFNSKYSKMTVTGCTFNNNTATEGGGAIWNVGDLIILHAYNSIGYITIIGCSFTNNSAFRGGVIQNDYGWLFVEGSSFIKNSAKLGGAINNWGPFTIISSRLLYNTASNGGAIFSVGNTVTVNYNTFVGNSATTGKAIQNYSSLNVSNNWWGTNNGPATGDVNGSVVPNWLVLKLSASPTTIGNNAHSTIKADLRYNNLGALAGGNVPNGIPVTFKTSLGTITQASTVNGIAQSTLTSGLKAGSARVVAKLDSQTLHTWVIIKDTLPPKVISTNPKNGARGISRSLFINIKFSENITKSINYNKITIRNLKTGKNLTLAKSLRGNTLKIITSKRSVNTWYKVTIPQYSIIDLAGNNLQETYTFKFSTKIPIVVIKTPIVISTIPNNHETSFSRKHTIKIKFNEKIKKSTEWSNIQMKNLTTGKMVSIIHRIKNNTLNIKMIFLRYSNNWYQITIPQKAIKDNKGHKLRHTYTFKFKTKT